jgi:hypothetical protein
MILHLFNAHLTAQVIHDSAVYECWIEKMWEKALMAWSWLLSHYLPRQTEENDGKHVRIVGILILTWNLQKIKQAQ